MAKFKEFRAELEQAVARVKRPENMKMLGGFIAQLIRVRTRLGYGVESAGGERKKLKALADATIRSRGGMIRITKAGKLSIRKNKNSKVRLSDQTTPGRSNLTRTGQLLDSLKPTYAATGVVVVGPDGTRRGEKKSNADIAYYVTKGGRAFLNLTRPEIRQVTERVRREMALELERILVK